MKNRTYHILGSEGFIGSVLMRELPKYCDNVIGINRNIIKDFTDLKEMKKYFKSMDNINSYVINCAASGGKELLGGYNKDELWNNIKINDNIMSLRDYYRFYINIGSGAELNKSNPIIDATEHDCMTILHYVVGIDSFIADWFKLHPLDSSGKPQSLPEDTAGRRENLKRYLLKKLPNQEEKIEAEIIKWADFTDYDDEYFKYTNKGGRKTMKRRKINNRKTKKNGGPGSVLGLGPFGARIDPTGRTMPVAPNISPAD
jgi:hypothetical protein